MKRIPYGIYSKELREEAVKLGELYGTPFRFLLSGLWSRYDGRNNPTPSFSTFLPFHTERYSQQFYPKLSPVTLAERPSRAERGGTLCADQASSHASPGVAPGVHIINSLIVPGGVAGSMVRLCQIGRCGRIAFMPAYFSTSKGCDTFRTTDITQPFLCGPPSTKHSFLIPDSSYWAVGRFLHGTYLVWYILTSLRII